MRLDLFNFVVRFSFTREYYTLCGLRGSLLQGVRGMAGGVNSLRANTYISSKFLNISYIPCRKNVCIDGEEKCPNTHIHKLL